MNINKASTIWYHSLCPHQQAFPEHLAKTAVEQQVLEACRTRREENYLHGKEEKSSQRRRIKIQLLNDLMYVNHLVWCCKCYPFIILVINNKNISIIQDWSSYSNSYKKRNEPQYDRDFQDSRAPDKTFLLRTKSQYDILSLNTLHLFWYLWYYLCCIPFTEIELHFFTLIFA